MDKSKIQQLADYAVRECCDHSENCHWTISYDELYYHFGAEVSDTNENGNDYAEYQLGRIYLYGNGAPKDYDTAMYYLHLAADHGNNYAAQLLHSIRVNGNFAAALASLRLLGHTARIIQNRSEDERRSRQGGIDCKLRRKIEEKKQAQGLKQ